MRKKTEKSIEQIALENYAWDKVTHTHKKIATIIGVAVGIIGGCILVSILHADLIVNLMFSLIIGGAFGGLTATVIIGFSWIFFRKKAMRKVITSLSEEDKKKIIKAYVIAQIAILKQDIEYDKRKSAFAVQVIQEYTVEKNNLQQMMGNDNLDLDEINEKISILDQEIAFFEEEYSPFKERILDNLAEKEGLENVLTNL